MNLTDVDDKTIRDSIAAGMSLDAFTQQYKDAFFEDLETLRIEPAEEYPAATDHIQHMIELVQTLLDKDFAYVGEDGSVYYSISKFEGYGKLARIDLSGQRSATRIKSDEYAKESVADFALWKAWQDSDGDVAWDSPWGRGRPGWHIECSAMSMCYLGPHFDIHTGGVDNMFPHHEDEIAQSEAATGETFVNYWLHCEHLMVDGGKMSKSLGNFYTLRDLLDKGYTGRELRWLLMSAHYRQKLNFTLEGLDAARTVLRRLDEFTRRLETTAGSGSEAGVEAAEALARRAESAFRAGLEDDLNIAEALAALFDFVRDSNRALDAGEIDGAGAAPLQRCCARLDEVLAVFSVDGDGEEEAPAEILALVAERNAAREARDWARSDAIRDELVEKGWRIDDTPEGTRVVRV
jgi:cysteinyl-tRNA synthetase